MALDLSVHLDSIRVLCERYHVERLFVFGSAVTEDFVPGRSDVDFLVAFKPLSPAERAQSYFGLKASLARLLGSQVDLVSVDPIRNPYVRATVEATRVPLYAAA